MTERLRSLIGTWCHVELNTDQFSRVLRHPGNLERYAWVEEELREAIESGELDARTASDLTNTYFGPDQPFDEWIAEIWTSWFPHSEVPVPAGS